MTSVAHSAGLDVAYLFTGQLIRVINSALFSPDSHEFILVDHDFLNQPNFITPYLIDQYILFRPSVLADGHNESSNRIKLQA